MQSNKIASYVALALATMSLSSVVVADDKVELSTIEVTDESSNLLEGNNTGYIELDKKSATGKLDVSVEDTPFAITVVDEDFIRDFGAKTIQDSLLYSVGVYSGQFGFDTRGDWTSVRGLDAANYLDGLRQIYGSYNSVRSNVYALEKVEVLKGPSSMLYGQAELGGIVNLVSKLPKEETGGEIWAQYGSFNRKQIGFDYNGSLTEDNTFLYRLVGLVRDSETQVDHVDDDGYFFSPSFKWNISEDTNVTLLINRQENKGQVSAQFLPQVGTLEVGSLGFIDTDTFVGEPSWDRYDRDKTEATIFFEHNFNDHWRLAATARYTDSKAETRQHWVTIPSVPAADGSVARTIFTADRETEIFNFDIRVHGNFELGITTHTIVAGMDRQDAEYSEDNYLYGYGVGGNINVYNPQYGNLNTTALAFATDRPDNEIEQTGIYVADHIEIEHFIVSLGLRRDSAKNTLVAVPGTGANTKSDESETTGRVGLMYQFENGISPYVSYAEAFSMNLGTDGTASGNALKPTTGDQKEVGVKFLSADKRLSVTAAYFDIEQQNRVANGATPGGVRQTGATVDGFELEIKKRWDKVEAQFAYTNLNAEDDATGIRLPYVAEKLASLWVKADITNQWSIGGGMRYVGDNVGFGGDPLVPSYKLFDAMISYQHDEHWQMDITAQNLTDKEYVSWCRSNGTDCGYGERRTINANLRYRF